MATTLDRLTSTRIIAVVRAPSADAAIRVADALLAGGVFGIEVTYSTPDAPTAIREILARHGDRVYLGAGTVTTPREAHLAAEAGARFLVSPGTRPELTAAMKSTGLLVATGAMTPTEVMAAVDLGSDVVKIFPASIGGPAFLRALRGPFPNVPLMPTGGVTPQNLGEWFAAGAIAVGVGTDLLSPTDLADGRFDEIERKARLFTEAGANG